MLTVFIFVVLFFIDNKSRLCCEFHKSDSEISFKNFRKKKVSEYKILFLSGIAL